MKEKITLLEICLMKLSVVNIVPCIDAYYFT